MSNWRTNDHVPEDCSLLLLAKCFDRGDVAFPEVLEERAVNCTQRIRSGRIDTEVELSHRLQLPELIGELSVGDHEGRDISLMEEIDEAVDVGVDNGLADQRESTVANCHGLFETILANTGDTLHLLDHLLMLLNTVGNEELRLISLPFPVGTNRLYGEQ